MTKSFIEEVREYNIRHRYNGIEKEMSTVIIAIDDLVNEYIKFTNFTENKQANGILKQIRDILEEVKQ